MKQALSYEICFYKRPYSSSNQAIIVKKLQQELVMISLFENVN